MTNFDLGEGADDADEPVTDSDETGDTAPSTDEMPTETDPTPSVPGTEPTDTSSNVDELDPIDSGPAFPYSEVRQSPLYAREETWSEFELELDVTLTPQLRQEGIRDDELREIHDIVLEIALDNLDEFPERLKEKRRSQ